jgi:hypothetical protein
LRRAPLQSLAHHRSGLQRHRHLDRANRRCRQRCIISCSIVSSTFAGLGVRL